MEPLNCVVELTKQYDQSIVVPWMRDSGVAALNPVAVIRIEISLELASESRLMVFGGLAR
jgi:hypothetical protein